MPDDDPSVVATPGRPGPVARHTVLGVIIALMVAAWAADLFLSLLLPGHPLVLIVLSDRIRNLVLASPHLGPVAYYLAGFVRVLAPDPFTFLLGRWYGQSAVRWVERMTPMFGRVVRAIEGRFSRMGYLLVVVMPISPVLVLAGSSEMSFVSFIAADAVGTAIMLVVVRRLTEVFRQFITDVDSWVGSHKLLMIGLCLVLIGVAIWSNRRSGEDSQLSQLAHLDEEYERLSHSEQDDTTTT